MEEVVVEDLKERQVNSTPDTVSLSHTLSRRRCSGNPPLTTKKPKSQPRVGMKILLTLSEVCP